MTRLATSSGDPTAVAPTPLSHLRRLESESIRIFREVAAECELTGGQIHNAVVYATLLALDNGGVVTAEYIDASVRREYRKRVRPRAGSL